MGGLQWIEQEFFRYRTYPNPADLLARSTRRNRPAPLWRHNSIWTNQTGNEQPNLNFGFNGQLAFVNYCSESEQDMDVCVERRWFGTAASCHNAVFSERVCCRAGHGKPGRYQRRKGDRSSVGVSTIGRPGRIRLTGWTCNGRLVRGGVALGDDRPQGQCRCPPKSK